MCFFAVRDDDISAWTDPGDLDFIYNPLWNKGISISFSVIPAAVKDFHPGDLQRFYQETPRKSLIENVELVTFLKQKLDDGLVEIMQHGYDHQYRVAKSRLWGRGELADKRHIGKLREGNREVFLRGECRWKELHQLQEETLRGKSELERIFHCDIKVFVPPSNQLSKAAIIAIDNAGLDISGIVGLWLDRGFSMTNFFSFVKRWLYRCERGYPFPYPLDYTRHRELVAYSLTPSTNIEKLIEIMERCSSLNAPFVLSTHYWELKKFSHLQESLYQLCHKADLLGFQYRTVSQCFRSGQ